MRFSVIIPLYNKAPYVAKAIQSVLAQTFTDYELIVVDDGSKDGSGEIADQAIKGHDHCRLLKQNNTGVSMARNNGVAASQGDYLCFLDADDWWEPTFLEAMAGLIESFPQAGIYGCNYTIVNETRHKTRVAKVGVGEGFEQGCINYCKAYASTMYMPLTSISVAIPRRIFEEVHGFPKGIKLGEDFLLWIKIALKHHVVFLNEPLAYYNQDVDVANRGTNHLYDPSEHMLWNLSFLESEEQTNTDFKTLVDRLRTDGLMSYLLDRRYTEAARKELAKVDWSRQPAKVRRLYRLPLWLLKLRRFFLRLGFQIKKLLFRYK